MKRKFSIWHTIGTIGVLAILFFSAGLTIFINFSTIIIVFGITFFMLLSTFQRKFIEFIPQSFLTLFSEPLKPNPVFAEIAVYGSRYIAASCVIAIMYWVIKFIRSATDISMPTSGMAICILPAIYALIVSELFFVFIYKVYSDDKDSKSNLSLFPGVNNLIGVIMALLVLLLLVFSFQEMGKL